MVQPFRKNFSSFLSSNPVNKQTEEQTDTRENIISLEQVTTLFTNFIHQAVDKYNETNTGK